MNDIIENLQDSKFLNQVKFAYSIFVIFQAKFLKFTES